MIADKIKNLREQLNMTQAALSKQLGITRSSVNAWEMGISVPSTQYIVELAHIFNVSTDFLLDINSTAVLSVAGLNDDDILIVTDLISILETKILSKVIRPRHFFYIHEIISICIYT